jgi:cation diffusion facilitator family transporter
MDSIIKTEKQIVAMGSMFASALMTVGKLVVGFSTGSLGILSEGLHSFMDFGATVLTYMAVRISDKPADPEHPYGHGKIENIAALAETALLFLTSFWIIYEAGHKLYKGDNKVEATWWSVGVIVASILIDIWRARALKKVAIKTKSQALEADALHFSSDVLSSGVVLVGLGFVAMGFPIGDPLAAIGVSIFVCHAGWVLGRRTIDTLIDTAPQGASERISKAIKLVKGIAGITRIRVRPVGSVTFVDVEVAVGRGLSLFQVADIKTALKAAIHNEMPDAEVSVSTVPLALDDETVLERVMIIARQHNAAVHHVTLHHLHDNLSISFDLEVEGQSTIRDAHATASRLESDMRTEFGNQTEVETHIEPLQDMGLDGADIGDEELKTLTETIARLAQEGGAFGEIHRVRARKTDMGLIVIFHCRTDPERTVSEVHGMLDDLERKIRAAHKGIWRIVAHAEPRKTPVV